VHPELALVAVAAVILPAVIAAASVVNYLNILMRFLGFTDISAGPDF
jgi:hypothetical protein